MSLVFGSHNPILALSSDLLAPQKMKEKMTKKISVLLLLAAVVSLSAMTRPRGGARAGGPKRYATVRVAPYVNKVNADAPARKTKSGIILIGSGSTLRACSPSSLGATSAVKYAQVANHYKEVFGDAVRVYCMPIPTAITFYCPDAARSWSHPVAPAFNGLFAALKPEVCGVDCYTSLGDHAGEAIYSRTDHHWAPLGGFYAARELARAAGVPFKGLDSYERKEVSPYVGTMAMYSKDPAVKAAPEVFVYYVPKGVNYKTTYINYTLRNHKTIIKESAPTPGSFFIPFKGASTYCTFMGGDSKIVKVETGTRNGRRILLIKDSFGNAVPGYLFFSFEQIHVVDSRYFNKNMVEYVEENGITDIVLCNNIVHASMDNISKNIDKFLVQ